MLEVAKSIIRDTIQPDDHILIGVSGGADSVALVHLLYSMGYTLTLVHINFHLRGAESDRDEAFVRQIHQDKFPKSSLSIIHTDTMSVAKSNGISIEMAARDIRYQLFAEIAQERKCQWIAVGHHADDQIETALLNLTRETGIKGLAGMKCVSGNIFRPFLTTWKSDLLRYLNAVGLDYVTDSTNLEDNVKRNYIRHHLIRSFEALNPSFKHGLLRSISHFREEEEVLDQSLNDFKNGYINSAEDSILLAPIVESNRLLFLLKRYLVEEGFNYTQAQNILQAWDNNKTTTFEGKGNLIQIYRKKLFVINHMLNDYYAPLHHTYNIPNIGKITLDGTYITGSLGIDNNIAKKDLLVRNAQKTDTFQPFGMKNGRKPLFTYLGEKGIPEYYRGYCPVLTLGEEVIAVIPFEVSETAKYSNAKDAIYLHFEAAQTPIGSILYNYSKAKGQRGI